MKILYFEVGKEVVNIDVDNDLKVLQDLIGGYMEVIKVDPKKKLILVCNQEARLLNMSVNRMCKILSEPIYGNFFICQYYGEEFCDIEENNIKEAMKYF